MTPRVRRARTRSRQVEGASPTSEANSLFEIRAIFWSAATRAQSVRSSRSPVTNSESYSVSVAKCRTSRQSERVNTDTLACHAGRGDFAAPTVHAPLLDLSSTYPLPSLDEAVADFEALARGETPV